MAGKSAKNFKYFKVRVPAIPGIVDVFWRAYIEESIRTLYGAYVGRGEDEYDEHEAMAAHYEWMRLVKATRLGLPQKAKLPPRRQMLLGDIQCALYRDGDYTTFFDTVAGMQRERWDTRF